VNVDYIDLSRIFEQETENFIYHNPKGLWVSVAGIHDWQHYCLKNNIHLEKLKSEFQIKLKPRAKILNIHNSRTFHYFLNKYTYYSEGIALKGDNYTLNLSIKWEQIIRDYQGLIIPKLLPKYNNLGAWYYIWHCTCGCIWDLQAVEKTIKLK
jgi:hypothetical protein